MVLLQSASYILALSILPTWAESMHLNLARRAPVKQDAVYYHGVAEGIRAKYGFATAADLVQRRTTKRGSTADIPVINQNADDRYIATVDIGSPPQSFNVTLDTGSSDLWVVDSSCLYCSPNFHFYNASKSSSNQAALNNSDTLITLWYDKGEVTGLISQETVSMGGFTVHNQTFVRANRITRGFANSVTSGFMGLAFGDAAYTRSTPFWQALASQGQFTSMEMSFWLARSTEDRDQASLSFGGVFTLGGTNSSLYTGDIEFIDMPVDQPWWGLSLTNITVQGQQVSVTNGPGSRAFIDTSTSFIGGLTDDVKSIWSAVPNAREVGPKLPGFWAFLEISVSFGGKSWAIDPEDMNVGSADEAGQGFCLGAIFDITLSTYLRPGPDDPHWVIGDTFLKNVYSVFRADPPSIGFAQLSGSNFSSDSTGQGASTAASSGTGSPGVGGVPMAISMLILSISLLPALFQI